MKFLTTIILAVFMASCAHHHEAPKHHHHAYNKQCAYSVSHGDLDVEGVSEYKIDHRGTTYYFSSYEKMEKFKKGMEKNINSANRNWSSQRER